MIISLLVYNLTNWLRNLCFSKEQDKTQIATIRTRIVRVSSKLVRSGRAGALLQAGFQFRVSDLLLESIGADSVAEAGMNQSFIQLLKMKGRPGDSSV
ncbi:Transposase DDE domain group 1 [Salimicrobium flavidum]|uniref:Transposase DDE domain group 1 n=1 Tax=Salimicrobium flavidum TaxID=570947 RepID=A0A1N7ISB1_9BACI|nr:Transposase DDE domain group 1 [Salimicrobium flavidum]